MLFESFVPVVCGLFGRQGFQRSVSSLETLSSSSGMEGFRRRCSISFQVSELDDLFALLSGETRGGGESRRDNF